MKKHIVITGGGGLLGRALRQSESFKNYRFSVYSRNPKEKGEFVMDLKMEKLDTTPLKDGPFILIHLAGANVASKRWSERFKQEMYESRLKPLSLIYKACEEMNILPEQVISGSATGYYPNGKTDMQDETFESGTGFLADLCVQWEHAASPFLNMNIPVVLLRTGVVMSKEGGFIPSFEKPIRWGWGAVIGDGHYRMPWIHIDDWVNAIKFIIENKWVRGAVNLCAPTPVTNQYITQLMAKILGKKIYLPPIPPYVIKLLLGEFSEELFSDKHILPKKITEAGFEYKFPGIDEAIQEIYK